MSKKKLFAYLLFGSLGLISLYQMINRKCTCFPFLHPATSPPSSPSHSPPLSPSHSPPSPLSSTPPSPSPHSPPSTRPSLTPSTFSRTRTSTLNPPSNSTNQTNYRFCLKSFNNTVLVNKSFEARTLTVFPALLSNLSAINIDLREIALKKTFLTEASAKNLSLKEIFRPSITTKEKLIYLYVFQTFIDMCQQYNITYFLYEGTLIGSYRHKGFVPWDDDIDIFVNASQRNGLIKAADAYGSQGFQLYTTKNFQWKFYHKIVSKSYSNKPFRWPYIDIFFWITANNSFYDFTHNTKENKMDLKTVIPLTTCLFEGLHLPCPADTKKFLDRKYSTTDICMTNSYSHKYEVSMPWAKRVPCKDLKDIFKFASHT